MGLGQFSMVALLSEDDDSHEMTALHAFELAQSQDTRLVTTDAVLIELLHALAGKGEQARRSAAELVKFQLASRLLNHPATLV